MIYIYMFQPNDDVYDLLTAVSQAGHDLSGVCNLAVDDQNEQDALTYVACIICHIVSYRTCWLKIKKYFSVHVQHWAR